MTAEIVTFTPAPTIEPFTYVGYETNKDVPGSRVTFEEAAGVIPLKTTGDSLTVAVTMTLPQNYGYTLEYVNYMITGTLGDLTNYNDLGTFLTLPLGVGPTGWNVQFFSEGETPNAQLVNELKMWRLKNASKNIFYNRSGASPICRARCIDDTTGDSTAAATLSFFASFLQFPIDQVNAAAVNSPLPVRVI